MWPCRIASAVNSRLYRAQRAADRRAPRVAGILSRLITEPLASASTAIYDAWHWLVRRSPRLWRRTKPLGSGPAHGLHWSTCRCDSTITRPVLALALILLTLPVYAAGPDFPRCADPEISPRPSEVATDTAQTWGVALLVLCAVGAGWDLLRRTRTGKDDK